MYVCVVTKNKSISATTLHSLMNINMYAMMMGKHVDVQFVTDMSGLPKLIKTGERIVWFDYGTNIDEETLKKLIEPFEKDVKVLVCPAVKEGIDWNMFRKKTLEGSSEPASQRALTFDTDVGKKLDDGLYEVVKTSARVWAMDSKPVDKKLRGEKIQVKLPTASYDEMFETLQKLGIRIGASTRARVVCHYIHECQGNILETPGVVLNN
jgi:hypothetical protein